MFKKGHPYYGGAHGVKGRSGRKKTPRNATRYFNELYDLNSFKLAEVTINKALAGDKELLQYCHDRRLGKPKQQTDIELTGGEQLGAGMIMEIFKVIARQDALRLNSGGIEEAIDTTATPLVDSSHNEGTDTLSGLEPEDIPF